MPTSNPYNLITHPYCNKGHQYALDVIAGKVLACVYVIGACNRYISDLDKGEYPFDQDAAERFMRLGQKFNHVKGEWKTDNVVFEPWQCFIFMNIYGFIDNRTGYRRFRTAYIEIPRANGKSAKASICGLYALSLDNPKGNEISCFATKSDQARIVLDSSRAMARDNPAYVKGTGVTVQAHAIKHDKSNSIMRARSSDHGSLDGLNDVLSIIDELHAVGQELYDVVVSGLKKRRDSLLLCITTAGTSTEGVGFAQSSYSKKVATGELEDDQTFAIIYTIDKGDDIFEESTWRKANPNYGVSVDPIAMASTAQKSREMPTELANFKVKNLNIWTSEMAAYFHIGKWDACADPTITEESFRGMRCRIGVDLASKVDLATYVKVFCRDGKYYIFDKSYIPEQTVIETPNNSLYVNSISQGYLIQMPGETVDQDIIRDSIIGDMKKFRLEQAMFDSWNAASLMGQLQKQRLEVLEFRMNTQNMSEPMKALDALIREGKIVHNGSPLLRWCMGNVVAKVDANDNVYPRKTHERLKIDISVALIMALAGWVLETKERSVYERESRGLRVL